MAQVREDLADVAKHAVTCIGERIPLEAQDLLTASQFMNSQWWGLSGAMTDDERKEKVDQVDTQEVMQKVVTLGKIFSRDEMIRGEEEGHESVPALLSPTVFVSDLDGLSGDGTRLLNSTLLNELEMLEEYIKLWPPDTTESSVDGMQPYAEFWASLLSKEDSNFVEECPNLAKLVEIVLVMPHGSVENERAFSLLNYVKSDG